ncbi:MAG TPA: hypothetical protein VJ276_20535 [Thermoanaerobaculia bacterium]|nr:hypothetical protein [Thermoanaerobaculia bacterium]
MDATARLLAIIAVAAFATERIVAAVSYLINTVRLSRVRSGVAVRLRTRERRKLVLFAVAAIVAFVVVARANLRLLHVLQITDVHPLVDFWMTWLVVVAGADRVHSIVAGGASGTTSANERSDTPVVRLEVDGCEVRDLHRAS